MAILDALVPGIGPALKILTPEKIRHQTVVEQPKKRSSLPPFNEQMEKHGIPNIAESRQQLIEQLPSTEVSSKLFESKGVVDASSKKVLAFPFELTKAKDQLVEEDASRVAQSKFGEEIEKTRISIEADKREETAKMEKVQGELEVKKKDVFILDEQVSETHAGYLNSAQSVPLPTGLALFYGVLIVIVVGLSFLFYGGLFDIGFQFEDTLLGRWYWARLLFGLFPTLITFWIGYLMINSDWVGGLSSSSKIGLYLIVFVMEVTLVDGYLAYVGTQQKINQQHRQRRMEEAVDSIKIPDTPANSSVSVELPNSITDIAGEKPLTVGEIITDPLFLKNFALGIMITLLLMLILPLVARELMKRDSPGSLRAALLRLSAKKISLAGEIRRLEILITKHASTIQQYTEKDEYLGRLYNSVLHRPDHIRACLNAYTAGWISVVSTSKEYAENRENDLKFIIQAWQTYQSKDIFTIDFDVK